MTQAPNWRIEPDTQKSQQQVNAIVNDIVRSILVGSDEELLTGQAIYDGVLRHPRLLALRNEQKQGKAEEKMHMENEMIIGRKATAAAAWDYNGVLVYYQAKCDTKQHN